METRYINWEGDWSNCETIPPKKSRMKWCNTCFEYHDLGCFFHHKGRWLKCFINSANRAWSMGHIKGSSK